MKIYIVFIYCFLNFNKYFYIYVEASNLALACEGEILKIDCKEGELIDILRANYGRLEIVNCNKNGNMGWSVNCTSPKTLLTVHERCNLEQECQIQANSSIFDDLCPGTYKYLEVLYKCKSDEIKFEPLFSENNLKAVTSTYDLINHIDKFKVEAKAKNFLKLLSKGMLGKDVQFDLRDLSIREETIQVFNLLFYSKDQSSLYKVAEWLKGLMNKEQYYYVLAAVLINRPDIRVTIPPWYHLFPNYFIKEKTLRDLEDAISHGASFMTVENEPQPGDTMAYFREDLDLNSFYYNWWLHFPTWMDPSKYGIIETPKTGEMHYAIHLLLLQRYNLELYGNNISPSLSLLFDNEFEKGYDPDMLNSVGQRMMPRSGEDKDSVKYYFNPRMEEVMERLAEVFSNRSVTISNTLKMDLASLGNEELKAFADLIFNTTNSLNPQYYGSFFDLDVVRYSQLGNDIEKKSVGGVIGYPMAAMRDHAYFRIMYDVHNYLDFYQLKYFPSYPLRDVLFPGIVIKSIGTDKLVTFFDHFEIHLKKSGKYKAIQKRLNHDPFSIYIKITNSKRNDVKVVVRVFLFPRTVETITWMMRETYVEIDKFFVQLTIGENRIERNFNDSTVYSDRREGAGGFFKKPEGCGLPNRLGLPRGSEEGKSYVMMILINDINDDNIKERTFSICQDSLDGRPFGWPFDRGIQLDSDSLFQNNAAIMNIVVYHRDKV